MIQISDEDYAKLKKDADDNSSIKVIVRWVVALIVVLLLYFGVATRFIDLEIKKQEAAIQCDIATMQAQNAVYIRQIQSEGMSMDDYLKWYEIYNKVG